MIAAIFISFLATIFAFLARYKKCKYGLELSFIIITVFLSLGYNWGSDVHGYMESFTFINSYKNNIFDLSTLDYRQQGEYGWVILNILCKPIGFFGMRILLFVFENYVIYRLIKKNVEKDWYWLAMFIYTFDTSFMVLSSSMMRQWLAMCIILTAIPFIQKKKPIQYTLLVLLAWSMHKSAIILLPFYFLGYLRYNFTYKSLLWIVPSLIAWFVFADSLLGNAVLSLASRSFDNYEVYLGQYYNEKGTGLGLLFRSILTIFVIIKLSYVTEERRIYAVLSAISLLFVPIAGAFGQLIGRLGMYFSICTLCAYPNFFAVVKPKQNIVMLGFLILYLFINIWTFSGFFTNSVWYDAYYHYHTIFEAPYWM